jgi:hypothetical protein
MFGRGENYPASRGIAGHGEYHEISLCELLWMQGRPKMLMLMRLSVSSALPGNVFPALS